MKTIPKMDWDTKNKLCDLLTKFDNFLLTHRAPHTFKANVFDAMVFFRDRDRISEYDAFKEALKLYNAKF